MRGLGSQVIGGYVKSFCSLLLYAIASTLCLADRTDTKSVTTNITQLAHYERFVGFRWNGNLNGAPEEKFPLFNLGFDQKRHFGIQNEINGWGGRTFTYPLLGKFGAVVTKNGSFSRGAAFEYAPTRNLGFQVGLSQDYALHSRLGVLQVTWAPSWVR